MVTCFLTRRRLDAFVDGQLDERHRGAVEAHVAACDRCRREVAETRRLRVLVAQALAEPVPEDWTGFWPGIVRGIEDGRAADYRPAPRPRPALGALRRPRVAAGALAAALVVSVTAWQFLGPTAVEEPVVVQSANTDVPGVSVMVYSPPEKDLAVVWLIGLEE